MFLPVFPFRVCLCYPLKKIVNHLNEEVCLVGGLGPVGECVHASVLCTCVSVLVCMHVRFCACGLPCVCECVCSGVCMQECVTVWRCWKDPGERHPAASSPGIWWTLGTSQQGSMIPQRPCGESEEAGCHTSSPMPNDV